MQDYGLVSVIIPTYNEEKYITRCIESLLQQDYPNEQMELLVVDGMSTDLTRTIVKQYTEKYSFIHLLDNPNKIVPYAMNIGIKRAQGTIIIRIDAHAEYASNYISTLARCIVSIPDAANVGAPCRTQSLSDTPKAKAIVAVLSNKFGVGNSDFRTGINHIKQVDTVPFGCWKKKAFERYGLFNTRLVRNQDIEMNKRITSEGGHIYLIPDTYSIYYARETYSALAVNNYNNGKWNILTIYHTNRLKSLSLRHFIPLVFLLSLLIPMVFGGICPYLMLISAVSLLMYLCLLGYVSIHISHTRKIPFYYILWAFITLHLSYGFGSLVGLLSIPWAKSSKTK